ncbi:hypothetical protein HYC85_011015 [Camellia sinensis]|uniref:Uncharacterized protein n=1 Tax=Camellia sinensis TaxID=4442 RepID=A0A7J7HLH2_CAMSI|nr:hypothetical protein HYC85_011015 [Camellia sinensis]
MELKDDNKIDTTTNSTEPCPEYNRTVNGQPGSLYNASYIGERYIIFGMGSWGLGYRRQSFDLKSPSFKEKNTHVTFVKNILESHASYLMSGKELSKLVAFVKGTQFDLVSHLAFSEYQDLLEALQEKLPSTGSLQEK